MTEGKYEVSAAALRDADGNPKGTINLLGRDGHTVSTFCTIDTAGALHLIRELSRAVQITVEAQEIVNAERKALEEEGR